MIEEKIQEKIDAQEKYCKDHHCPMFAPHDGRCWACYSNIFSEKGYTLNEARSNLITSCPYCRTSFCD